jgi:hypothetical protein
VEGNLPGFNIALWYCGILFWIMSISYSGMLCFHVHAYSLLVCSNIVFRQRRFNNWWALESISVFRRIRNFCLLTFRCQWYWFYACILGMLRFACVISHNVSISWCDFFKSFLIPWSSPFYLRCKSLSFYRKIVVMVFVLFLKQLVCCCFCFEHYPEIKLQPLIL